MACGRCDLPLSGMRLSVGYAAVGYAAECGGRRARTRAAQRSQGGGPAGCRWPGTMAKEGEREPRLGQGGAC